MGDQIKQALEKEVTCPLCLGLFKEPKKLPCDHVYCKNCLKGIILCSLNQSISCPECRKVVDVPNNDVNNLPTAFRVNRLVEVFQEATSTSVRTCAIHKDQPLALYCETCKLTVCQVCRDLTKEHQNHQLGHIESYREKHENRLRMTKKWKGLLSQAHSQISEVEGRTMSKETANQEAIDHAFEDLHKALEESKQSMKQQLSREYQSALNNLSQHKLETERIQALATHVTSLVQSAISSQNEELFMQEKWIKKKFKQLKHEFEQFPSKVAEPHLPVPKVMSCESLKKLLDACNFLYMPTDPKKCQIETATISSGTDLLVNLVDPSGSSYLRGEHEIKAELHSLQDDTLIRGTIQHLSQDCASLTFESPKQGGNELSVTIRGIHVTNSPQSTYIHAAPTELEQPVTQIKNIEGPAGLRHCGENMNDVRIKFLNSIVPSD